MQRSLIVEKTPFYYGWVIVAAGTLGIVMTSPGQTYAVSIFIEHFISDLSLSRSLVSTLYAVGTLIGSLALATVGREIDRRGSRVMVLLIAVAFGLACIYMGTVRGALTLGFGFILIRMLGQGSLGLVSQNVINQWWVTRRGTIMGISGLFSSLLGLGLFPSLINWMIPEFGWRASYMVLGVALLVVMAPLGYLLFREKPEHFGLLPDGDGAAVNGATHTGAHERRTPIRKRPAVRELTREEALRTPAFWILAAGASSLTMLSTAVFFHLVSIFADNNLPASVAASVYVPIAATTALMTLVSGVLLDRISVRYALAAALFLLALSMGLVQVLSSVALALLFGVLWGATTGLFRVVSTVAWAHYFGREHLGAISGAATTIMITGAAIGPIPLGVAHDLFGSFNQALTLLALIPVGLGVASLVGLRTTAR